MSKKSEGLSRTKIRSRKNLITAFELVFRKKPLEKISIKEITDAAGYNRSTFYLYFSDIYELADAFETSVLEETASAIGDVIEQNASLPLMDMIGLVASAAGEHVDRIYLCSQLPGFTDHFRKTLQPLFETVTGIESAAAEHDFLLSLMSSLLLHNIAYLHDHGDELSAGEIIGISRRFVTPGLMALISDHRS